MKVCYNSKSSCGVWRSLVARTAGGREVAGSNPVAPMIPEKAMMRNITDQMDLQKAAG